jgi:predicted ATP-dependent Lon-type protease
VPLSKRRTDIFAVSSTEGIVDKLTLMRHTQKRCAYVTVDSYQGKAFEKLLAGGIWCIVTLNYFFEENQKGSPFRMVDLKPIQMPNMDMDALKEGRRYFTEDQWIEVLYAQPAWSQLTLKSVRNGIYWRE